MVKPKWDTKQTQTHYNVVHMYNLYLTDIYIGACCKNYVYIFKKLHICALSTSSNSSHLKLVYINN